MTYIYKHQSLIILVKCTYFKTKSGYWSWQFCNNWLMWIFVTIILVTSDIVFYKVLVLTKGNLFFIYNKHNVLIEPYHFHIHISLFSKLQSFTTIAQRYCMQPVHSQEPYMSYYEPWFQMRSIIIVKLEQEATNLRR
jgi:hypothetical protein